MAKKKVHCFDCNQACCRSAVIEVESPKTMRDHSDLVFYLHHENVQVVVIEGRRRQWYVEFMTPCRNLAKGRCAVYARRPKICREYDMDGCERNTRERVVHLRAPQDLYAYLREINRPRIADRLQATHS